MLCQLKTRSLLTVDKFISNTNNHDKNSVRLCSVQGFTAIGYTCVSYILNKKWYLFQNFFSILSIIETNFVLECSTMLNISTFFMQRLCNGLFLSVYSVDHYIVVSYGYQD